MLVKPYMDVDSEAESWPKNLICLPLFAFADKLSERDPLASLPCMSLTALLLRWEPESIFEPLFSRVGLVKVCNKKCLQRVLHCGKTESLPG
jgi:hypothetical protein